MRGNKANAPVAVVPPYEPGAVENTAIDSRSEATADRKIGLYVSVATRSFGNRSSPHLKCALHALLDEMPR
jgi:hypothetical protein